MCLELDQKDSSVSQKDQNCCTLINTNYPCLPSGIKLTLNNRLWYYPANLLIVLVSMLKLKVRCEETAVFVHFQWLRLCTCGWLAPCLTLERGFSCDNTYFSEDFRH
jgi:hypothetical protein